MEKIPNKPNEEMLFADHLEELNDLRYNRDAPLEETEKNKQDLESLADEIIDRTEKSGKKLFYF